MRHHYFVNYPRDFANEYTVYAVPPASIPQFRALFPEAEPISRPRAIHLGWTRPREARRDGEQWFGGLAEPMRSYDPPTTLADALMLASEGTADALAYA